MVLWTGPTSHMAVGAWLLSGQQKGLDHVQLTFQLARPSLFLWKRQDYKGARGSMQGHLKTRLELTAITLDTFSCPKQVINAAQFQKHRSRPCLFMGEMH